MSLLMRNYAVSTRYSGGFVQSIDGLAGGHEGGRPVDWFYYVNGVAGGRGARRPRTCTRATTSGGTGTTGARPSRCPRSSAPSPSRSSTASKASGCRCASNAPRSPATRARRSTTGSAQRASPSRSPAPGAAARAEDAARARGPLERASRRPVGRRRSCAARARAASTRTFAPGGRSLTVLDADGRAARTLGAGSGLIAATRREEAAPVWLVTGTDEGGRGAGGASVRQRDARAPLRRRPQRQGRFPFRRERMSVATASSPVLSPDPARRATAPEAEQASASSHCRRGAP